MIPVRHDVMISLRTSREVNDAIAAAAVARGIKPATWLREAIGTVLAVEGFNPGQAQPPEAA